MPSLMAAEGGIPSLMAAGAPVVLTAYQGDDKRWLFRLKKDDGGFFDLTGYTAALQFRTAVADTDTATPVTPVVTVTDPSGGEITVELRSESSQLLTQPVYVWDLEITKTVDSWTTTVAVGTLAVTKEVTRTGAT
jgi:hypothetical protein